MKQPDHQLVLKEQEPTRVNYPFVDLIRFIAMMGVVWAHINIFPPHVDQDVFVEQIDRPNLYIFFMQSFKFAVICFFMISGFLLGAQFDRYSPLTYFKRRFASVIKPYAVAFILLLSILCTRQYVLHRDQGGIHSFGDIIHFCFLSSHLWYLPNYLICLSMLLCFHKFVRKISFGIILLLITIAYAGLTVYTVTFELPHTAALFAFVFYLWLGLYINQHHITEKIVKIDWRLLLGLVIALYLISSYEACVLYKYHLNYFNVLRIFNQLYSVAMFAFLVRICKNPPKFRFFNPRKETYGIYLYHGIIMYYIAPKVVILADTYLHIPLYTINAWKYIPLALTYFAVCYLATTLLVKLLIKFNLGFLKNS